MLIKMESIEAFKKTRPDTYKVDGVSNMFQHMLSAAGKAERKKKIEVDGSPIIITSSEICGIPHI